MNASAESVVEWLRASPVRDDIERSEGAPADAWDSVDDWVRAGRRIPAVDQELSRLLADQGDPVDRSAAAIGLGYLGSEASVAPLIAALEHDVAMVATEAAVALGRLGRPEATESLCAAAASAEDANVRASACTALARLGGARARACLGTARNDPDSLVRKAAEAALRALDEIDHA
jgi:HEAT repeat protein